MGGLEIQQAIGDAALGDWQHVHNSIIPTHHRTLEDVRESAQRYRLDVAYVDDVLVGCSTVRPPEADTPAATVIARVLPAYRRRGVGSALYAQGLAQARTLGAEAIETIVLESNSDGLDFALNRGFVEVERYLLSGDTIRWITLRLPSAPG